MAMPRSRYPQFLIIFTITLGLGYLWHTRADLHTARNIISVQSEKSSSIYNGKVGAVYNPLDKAFLKTKRLEELKKKEDSIKYENYKKWDVLSIWIDEKDLYDNNRGIIKNPLGKGRLWERASYVYYYVNGQNVFESYAGLRLHGGSTRVKFKKIKSYKLIFRKSYGEQRFTDKVPLGLFEENSVKRLVARIDGNHHFVNALGFDIVRKLGGLAPKTRPVVLYVNGEKIAYHFLSEQISEEQFQINLKHSKFYSYFLKGENDPVNHLKYKNLINIAKYAPEPIDLNHVKEYIDIDNFTANILGIAYTGNSDWAQGAILKNLKEDTPKWKWVAWDFDRAFYHIAKISPKRDHPWEIKGIAILVENYRRALRSRFLRRLINESIEYKEIFSVKVDEMFNLLDKKFFDKKFSEIDALVSEMEGEDPRKHVELLKSFVSNRMKTICLETLKFVQVRPKNCKTYY